LPAAGDGSVLVYDSVLRVVARADHVVDSNSNQRHDKSRDQELHERHTAASMLSFHIPALTIRVWVRHRYAPLLLSLTSTTTVRRAVGAGVAPATPIVPLETASLVTLVCTQNRHLESVEVHPFAVPV